MRAFDFTTPCGTNKKEVKVHVERFSSCAEVVSLCSKRDLVLRSHSNDDYFVSATRCKDPEWAGFKDAEDMKERLKKGLKDKDLVANTKKFMQDARAQDIARINELRMEVCGGSVNIPRYLAGAPDCMWQMKKNPRKSDIIHIGINCGVTCGVSKESAKKVGQIIARAIYSIEKAGYRARVDALALHGDIKTSDYIAALSIPLKNPDAALSLPRLLYPLCDMSFFRGVSFAWVVQDQTLSDVCGLSCRPDSLFRGPNKQGLISDMYQKIVGPNSTFFDFNVLVDKLGRGTPEDMETVEKLVISRLIDTGCDDLGL